MQIFAITDFGAVGDGTTNDAAAIQAAIDACHAAGGGRVLVPAGRTYCSGTVELRSDVELYLERGATLHGSANPADYRSPLAVGALSGGVVTEDQPQHGVLILAHRAERIALGGDGIIDGNGRAFIATPGRYIHTMLPSRPFTIFFLGCRDVTVRDLTIRDGALWTLRLSGCDQAQITNIKIDNDLRLPNNDGIDLDRCRNVRISGCHIVSGDDCIVLKACEETAAYGHGCENIVVSGCTLTSTSAALCVGCECRAPMRNIIFDTCVISASHRGLTVRLSEASDIEQVIFSNMIVETRLFHDAWWGRGEPIYVSAVPWEAGRGIGRVRTIRFQNILCQSENGVVVHGWTPEHVQDIVFDNVRLELHRWTSWPGGRLDLRPWPGEALPSQPTAAFFLCNAQDVTLRNCTIVWADHAAEFGHAIASYGVADLQIEGLRGNAAHPELPLLLETATPEWDLPRQS
jgi:hypothetical protein